MIVIIIQRKEVRNMEKTEAKKEGDTLYISAPRSKFIPSYVYYMLEHFQCEYVCFGLSNKRYPKHTLKGCDTWKEVMTWYKDDIKK